MQIVIMNTVELLSAQPEIIEATTKIIDKTPKMNDVTKHKFLLKAAAFWPLLLVLCTNRAEMTTSKLEKTIELQCQIEGIDSVDAI